MSVQARNRRPRGNSPPLPVSETYEERKSNNKPQNGAAAAWAARAAAGDDWHQRYDPEKAAGLTPLQRVDPRPGPVIHAQDLREERLTSYAVALGLTFLAVCVRFWGIRHPAQVVFDEVHFGGFANQYLRREYYFDVHPPLAKMLNALAGWFVGYDGNFGFTTIGDDYVEAGVPYVAMRSFVAIMGAVTIPLVYAIMRESGYPIVISAFSAFLVLFDNGHITQTRLILLDAALCLFMALTLFTYVKFHQMRYREFTREWWFWLLATGFSLACTLGCKMVGLFTFFTVGSAVIWDLWEILDIKRGHSMAYWWRHFIYRAIGLIVFPFILYLSFFWVHFKILKFSGPGDSFMSPAFQETLQGNELLLNSQEIRYYDTITLKHKSTKQFLHSHVDKYPMRYPDGRISSQGQQVTCYPHNDTNNHWQIIPTRDIPETGRGRVVRQNDIVQFRHVGTNTVLLTHDVASPTMPTNQEFTTIDPENKERQAETFFQLSVEDAHDGEPIKTLSSHFKVMHMKTHVWLWTHNVALPEWGHGQQEVNGNKKSDDSTLLWLADEIVEDGQGLDFQNRTAQVDEKPVRKMAFLKKWWELQILMLQHNAGLSSSHPYASNPIEWPFTLSGVSFWTDADESQQVYMVGNLLDYWICSIALSIFIGVIAADMIARRRGIEPIETPIRNRLYRNTGFFLLAWAFHYFPFFTMARQRFLHHYMPAHIASALVAGGVINFILVEAVNYPMSQAGPRTRLRPVSRVKFPRKKLGAMAALFVAVFACFAFLAPFTYGTSLTPAQVGHRKLLSTWTLHFEPKVTHDVDVPAADSDADTMIIDGS